MRTRLLLAALAMAAALSAGCANDDPYGLKDLPAPPPEQSAPTTSAPADAAEMAPSKLGQPAAVGTWLLVAKSADRSPVAGDVEAKKGKELVVIKVELSNGGALDEDTHPDYFRLVSPDGTEHKPVDTEEPDFVQTTPQPIVAGEAREMSIIFSVEQGDGPFRFELLPMSEEGKNPPAVIEIE